MEHFGDNTTNRVAAHTVLMCCLQHGSLPCRSTDAHNEGALRDGHVADDGFAKLEAAAWVLAHYLSPSNRTYNLPNVLLFKLFFRLAAEVESILGIALADSPGMNVKLYGETRSNAAQRPSWHDRFGDFPTEWWEHSRQRFPKLASIAISVLCLPPNVTLHT
eukprot:PhM_4_TR10093/c0_g4_i2/m.19687